MIEKTEALVLRIAPFSRTSHVVTWLTPEYGRLVTPIKGACRPKSMFLGQYDLFYTCELLFYIKERQGLHIPRECSPINLRPFFRSNWRAYAIASYLCDLVNRLTSEGHPQADIYDLLVNTLDSLCQGEPRIQIIFWFELQLAHLIGLTPRLANCLICGSSALQPGKMFFAVKRGGILCPKCTTSGEQGASIIQPDILATLISWQKSNSPKSARNTSCTSQQIAELARLLGIFLHYHLDILPKSRYTAIQTLMFLNSDI